MTTIIPAEHQDEEVRILERLRRGWKSAEARDRDSQEIFRIVNEETREPVESPVTRVLRIGVVVGLANSTVLIAADGTERPIDDSGAPILGIDGAIRGVVPVFRDISDRRRTEAERRAAVKERERLLENERAARSEAENANQSKDEFVAMVSHELRKPLNAILGWTRILKTSSEDAAMRRKGIDVIERSARMQEQLVSDLLDMSRIISGATRRLQRAHRETGRASRARREHREPHGSGRTRAPSRRDLATSALSRQRGRFVAASNADRARGAADLRGAPA